MPDSNTIHVAIKPEQMQLLQAALDRGEYASLNDIIQEAIAAWQAQHFPGDTATIRRLWEEGLASGPPEALDFDLIRQTARNRLRGKTTHKSHGH